MSLTLYAAAQTAQLSMGALPRSCPSLIAVCAAWQEVAVRLESANGRCRYAYVEFTEPSLVPNALVLNESVFRGRNLKVRLIWPFLPVFTEYTHMCLGRSQADKPSRNDERRARRSRRLPWWKRGVWSWCAFIRASRRVRSSFFFESARVSTHSTSKCISCSPRCISSTSTQPFPFSGSGRRFPFYSNSDVFSRFVIFFSLGW